MSDLPRCGHCDDVLATKDEIARGFCIVCSGAAAATEPPKPSRPAAVTPIRPRGSESPEYAPLPRWFLHACERYVAHRELIDEPFFASMLTSDVRGIVQGADDTSQATLFLMLKYLYNHVPSVSWGSEPAVGAWLGGKPEGETTS